MGCNETDELRSQLKTLQENEDMFFVLINGVVVSLMQAGFACLEAGAVHSKNTANIILKNFLDLFLCGTAWWLVGYPLAYGGGGPVAGTLGWAGVGLPENKYAHWFFQFVFAATAATVLAGAVAERCQFVAYLIYSPLVSGITYPLVAHWVWSESGWLNQLGYDDFAGSGAVHAFAGACSIVAAAILGPRRGRFAPDGTPQSLPGHSLPLVGLGALLLVSGFLSFNGGTISMISQQGDGATSARAMIGTVLAGSGAAIVALVLAACRALPASWPFSFTLNAVLSGMVAVCAGANEYPFLGAFMVGAIACPIYWAVHNIVVAIKVDDPLDTAAVHLGAGMWGVLAKPLIGPKGVILTFSSDAFQRLGKNALGVCVISLWAAVTSTILFGSLRALNIFRVASHEEAIGLDESKHGEVSYPVEAWHWQPMTQSMATPNPTNGCLPEKKETFAKQDFENLGFEMEKKSYP